MNATVPRESATEELTRQEQLLPFLLYPNLTFEEGDDVVEYTVKMRKLSERYFLDQLVKRDAVGPQDLNRIASALKTLYEGQHPSEGALLRR